MTLRIVSAESTDLFVGTDDAPLQVLRVAVDRSGQPGRLVVTGPGVRGEAEVPGRNGRRRGGGGARPPRGRRLARHGAAGDRVRRGR